jgi:hypothetical protein
MHKNIPGKLYWVSYMKRYFKTWVLLASIMLGALMVLPGLHGVFGFHGSSALCQQVSVAAVSPNVNPTGVGSNAATSAQLVNYGTDKDTYKRGETANGYATIKNTGNSVIDTVTISAKVSRSMPLVGSLSVLSKDFKVTGLNIKPGETKKAQFAVNIPSTFSGFSTAGSYDINGNVLVNGKQVGSFSKHIRVV